MPELDGFEVAAAVRGREKGTGRRLPLVALTAHAMQGDRERCLAAGMDGYVTKPIQMTHLTRVMAEVLTSGGRRLPPNFGTGLRTKARRLRPAAQRR